MTAQATNRGHIGVPSGMALSYNYGLYPTEDSLIPITAKAIWYLAVNRTTAFVYYGDQYNGSFNGEPYWAPRMSVLTVGWRCAPGHLRGFRRAAQATRMRRTSVSDGQGAEKRPSVLVFHPQQADASR